MADVETVPTKPLAETTGPEKLVAAMVGTFHNKVEGWVKKRRAVSGPRSWGELGSRRSVHAKRVAPAERIALPALIPVVSGIEVGIHAGLQRGTDKVLQAIRDIGGQIPAIAVGQEMHHAVALRDRPVGL